MTAASIFDELEELTDAPWFIEPRDKDPRSEEARQMAVLRDARILCPAVVIFSVPNAGRRTQWEVNKAKREGLRAGVCDLVCVWNRGVAFIEMKDGQKMPTPAQRDFLNSLQRAGHWCGVFRQEKTVLDFLRQAGAPFL